MNTRAAEPLIGVINAGSGVPAKWKSSMSLASGSLAMVS